MFITIKNWNKEQSYMDLFPLHPRTRKPSLGSSLEWLESVVEGPPWWSSASFFLLSEIIACLWGREWIPRAGSFASLNRHDMDLGKPKKRRPYGHARVPRLNKSARADFHPLGRFSSVPAVNLSGIIRSEKINFFARRPIRSEGWGSARRDFSAFFSGFALFLVLNPVYCNNTKITQNQGLYHEI